MIDKFLSSKSLSSSTKIKYRKAITNFLFSFSDPSLISSSQLENYLNSFNWSSSNQWVVFNAIKQFLSFCYGPSHPALILKIKRFPSPPQRVLTLDQVKLIFSKFDTSKPSGRRDLSMFVLFLDSGLRVSEVSNLLLNSLHIDQLYCDVFIKGGKWERAIFSEYTGSCLISWLADRSIYSTFSCKTIFCSLGGNTPGYRLTREGIQRIVLNWGKKIDIKLSPHDLRRTFATLATISGAPSRLLQAAGRWSDISMVEHYTKSIQVDNFRPYFPSNLIIRD